MNAFHKDIIMQALCNAGAFPEYEQQDDFRR